MDFNIENEKIRSREIETVTYIGKHFYFSITFIALVLWLIFIIFLYTFLDFTNALLIATIFVTIVIISIFWLILSFEPNYNKEE